MTLYEPCHRDPRCYQFDRHPGECRYPVEADVLREPTGQALAADLNATRQDRSFAEASSAIDWRLVGEAPIVDLPACVCGEERVDAEPNGYRCVACGLVRRGWPEG